MTGYAVPPIPRAIVGGVRCMARPRRPMEEAALVQEAAEIIRHETDLTSARAVSREIARRVVGELLHELDGDPLDLAIAAIELNLLRSPFQQLASCPKVNVVGEFVDQQIIRLSSRAGRYLSVSEQQREKQAIADSLLDLLAGRYDRHLRSTT